MFSGGYAQVGVQRSLQSGLVVTAEGFPVWAEFDKKKVRLQCMEAELRPCISKRVSMDSTHQDEP